MTQTRYFPLQGGLDRVTPAIQIPAGRAIEALNYEPHPRGYQRLDGYERFDGRLRPSDASYWIVRFRDGVLPISEGDVVVGATSGATGIAIEHAVVESGDYGDGDAAGWLVIANIDGALEENEGLEIASDPATPRMTVDAPPLDRGATNDADDARWWQEAIELARASITPVPGSGPVRGVWLFNGDVYAFRDSADGTRGVMHKATPQGWDEQVFGRELAFTGGGLRELAFTEGGPYEIKSGDTITGVESGAVAFVRHVVLEGGSWANGDAQGRLYLADQSAVSFGAEKLDVGDEADVATIAGDSIVIGIEEGDAITGGTSGATATVQRVVLERGHWSTNDAAGRLIFADQTGAFQTEEIGTASASGLAAIAGDAGDITLPPGGRYQFVTHNFYGSADLKRMYGVNGEGRGFEWDGSVLVPIATGMADDRPIRVAAHRNHLFYAYRGGSLQHSSIGEPYQWQVVTGAAEIGIGEEITDLLADVSGVLAIFGRGKVAVLYGDDAENWQLQTLANDSGAFAWTAQKIGTPLYLDSRGLRALETTDQFGDFIVGTVTQLVEPIFRTKRKDGVHPVGSLRVRGKDQYRLFWSDGTGLTLYFGRRPAESLPFDLGFAITCAASNQDGAPGDPDAGDERLFVGSESGFVYELDRGTSFDGQEVEAFIRLPFNHVGSPAQRKRWQKAVVEVDCGPDTTLGLTAEYSYANPDQPPSAEQDFMVRGSGGFWDEMRWDEFYWSSPVEGQAETYLDGLGFNVSLTIVSRTTYENPHVLHGVLLYFTYRGLVR